MTTIASAESDLLHKPGDVAERFGITTAALAQMRYMGTGPRFIKLSGKQVRYRESEIQAWLDQQTRDRT